MIFQFVEEPAFRRDVIGAFLQDAADMRGERHVRQQLAFKDFFALVRLRVDELFAGVDEFDIAALDFNKMQHLQGVRNRKEIVALHVQLIRR